MFGVGNSWARQESSSQRSDTLRIRSGFARAYPGLLAPHYFIRKVRDPAVRSALLPAHARRQLTLESRQGGVKHR